MTTSHSRSFQGSAAGDTAVSGLFNGLWGGLGMAAIILFTSLLAGQGLDYLGYFSAETPVHPLVGLLGHLAVASIYGMIYALLRRWTGLSRQARLPGWLAGSIYALGLWALAVGFLLPAAQSLLLSLPWGILLSSHLVYGWVLGLLQKT